jgi:hypothetical protein
VFVLNDFAGLFNRWDILFGESAAEEGAPIETCRVLPCADTRMDARRYPRGTTEKGAR